MFRLLTLLAVFCAFAVPVTALPPVPACAAEIEDKACDPEYIDAVEAKGWLEAHRETAMNQNLLYKLDSVLEYTCFQQFLETFAVRGSPRFSETQKWKFPEGFSETSTDVALQKVVGIVLVSYLQANFPHTYMGGRLEISTDPAPTRPNGQYLCDAMQYVWQESKCSMFMDKSAFTGEAEARDDLDGFYEFTRYAELDPRGLPRQFAACAAAAQNISMSMNSAYRSRQTQYVLPEDNPNSPDPYVADPLTTRLEYILPDTACGEGKTPAPMPIATGITVTSKAGGLVGALTVPQEYEEKVCLNPGCSYNGEKCTQGP